MSLQFSLMSLHPIHQTSYSIWNRIDCQIGLLFLYAPDSQNFTVDLYDTLSALQEAAEYAETCDIAQNSKQ